MFAPDELKISFAGKRVLVTGHTGFKGSWMTLWLLKLGAEVCGYSNEVPTNPSLFELAKLADVVRDVRGDINDYRRLKQTVDEFQPEIVFHLAAQPLVRLSYHEPLGTFATNVMGTANVLQAIRGVTAVRAAVVVTTDKCYENVEWEHSYRETDRLGGHDPYSASKACSELVFSSFYKSFFFDQTCRIASARAGNVIGGGDWSADRIVPDCISSWRKREKVVLRNPSAVRPWQHVLDAIHGYLQLGADLLSKSQNTGHSFNFGPEIRSRRTVLELVDQLKTHLPSMEVEIQANAKNVKEAHLLFLNWEKANIRLKWEPVLNFHETVEATAHWYKLNAEQPADSRDVTLSQIELFESKLRESVRP